MTEKKAKKKATKNAKPAAKKYTGEAAVLEKIAAMPEPYRPMGERLHALILRDAPALQPTVWYRTRKTARPSASSARTRNT